MIELIAFSAVLSALYLVGFCYRDESWLKTCVKTAAVLGLAVTAWVGGGPALLVAALLLCSLGDFCLSRPGNTSFLIGVGAFAAGHIAYIFLFLTIPREAFTVDWLVLGLGLAGLVMMGVLYRFAGELRVAVLAYVPIIVVMGVLAIQVSPNGALKLVQPAALLFVLSDTILAFELFVLGKSHPLRRLTPFAVWSLYWLAQLGFLLAFVPLVYFG